MADFSDAITKFLNTPQKISEVVRSGNEYYFRFGKHAFSISKNASDSANGVYSFYVYPVGGESLSALVGRFERGDFEDIEMIGYHEASLSDSDTGKLAKLYQLVQEKYLNIDKLFDDVLNEE